MNKLATLWRVLLALAALGLVVATFMPVVNSSSTAIIPVVQSASRVWVLLAAVLLAVAALSRAWLAVGMSAVAILSGIVPVLGFPSSPCPVSGDPLRVMSLNTEFGRADPNEIVAAVKADQIDVLVLTEANFGSIDALQDAGLAHLLPYTLSEDVDASSSAGTIIWSSLPLTGLDVDEKYRATHTFGEPAATVMVGETKVIIRAVHPYPPLPGWLAEWSGGLSQLGAWQRSVRGTPVVMMGDFNAGRGHPAFREAVQGMSDALGWLPPATWPADQSYWPFTTIDHILVRGLASSDGRTLRITGTDHLGVRADVRVCSR